MTPSEKAVSLVDYFMPIVKDLEAAKKCAVMVCKEIRDTHNALSEEVYFQNQVIEQIKAIR